MPGSPRRLRARRQRARAVHGARVDSHAGGSLGALEAVAAGDFASARAIMEVAVRRARAAGDLEGLAASLQNLAQVHLHAEDYKAARQVLEEAVRVGERLDDPRFTAAAHYSSAQAAIALKDYSGARTHCRKAVALAEESGQEAVAATALGLEGRALALSGKHQAAVERFITSAFRFAKVGEGGSEILAWMADLKREMGEEAYYTAWDAADKALGRPLTRNAVARGFLAPGGPAGVTVEDLRRVLEEE